MYICKTLCCTWIKCLYKNHCYEVIVIQVHIEAIIRSLCWAPVLTFCLSLAALSTTSLCRSFRMLIRSWSRCNSSISVSFSPSNRAFSISSYKWQNIQNFPFKFSLLSMKLLQYPFLVNLRCKEFKINILVHISIINWAHPHTQVYIK